MERFFEEECYYETDNYYDELDDMEQYEQDCLREEQQMEDC